MTGVGCNDTWSGGCWAEKKVKEPGQAILRTFHTQRPGDRKMGVGTTWVS